jgi:hypothetical protein
MIFLTMSPSSSSSSSSSSSLIMFDINSMEVVAVFEVWKNSR